MSKNDVWQFIIGVLIVAVIFMLVRPGAPSAIAVNDISNALSGLIKTATDYTVPTPGQPQRQTG